MTLTLTEKIAKRVLEKFGFTLRDLDDGAGNIPAPVWTAVSRFIVDLKPATLGILAANDLGDMLLRAATGGVLQMGRRLLETELKPGDRAKIVKIDEYPGDSAGFSERQRTTLARALANDLREADLEEGDVVTVSQILTDDFCEIAVLINEQEMGLAVPKTILARVQRTDEPAHAAAPFGSW